MSKIIYSKETLELLDGAPTWTWEFLDSVLKARAKAKTMEDDAGVIKKDAHEKMEVIWASAKLWPEGLDKLNIKSSMGSVTYQPEGESRSLGKNRLMHELMKLGLTAQQVAGAMERSTSVSPRASYTRYVPPKEAKI